MGHPPRRPLSGMYRKKHRSRYEDHGAFTSNGTAWRVRATRTWAHRFCSPTGVGSEVAGISSKG